MHNHVIMSHLVANFLFPIIAEATVTRCHEIECESCTCVNVILKLVAYAY